MNESKKAIIKAELVDLEDRHVMAIYHMRQQQEVNIDGTIEEVTSWNNDGSPYKTDFFASVYIKWDSCSHFHFTGQDLEDRDGYYHICGTHSYLSFMRLLVFAHEIMIKYTGGVDLFQRDGYESLKALDLLKDYEIRYTYGDNEKGKGGVH